MTHPTLDEVAATLTSVLGPVTTDLRGRRGLNKRVDWDRAGGYVFAIDDWFGYGCTSVTVHPHDDHDTDPSWLVTRDGLPIDGDDTVTLDALPGLVRTTVEALGLGEAVGA